MKRSMNLRERAKFGAKAMRLHVCLRTSFVQGISMSDSYCILLKEIVEEFDLEILYGPENFLQKKIIADDVNRPGLQLAGFFDYFDNNRMQVIGKVEITFLQTLTHEQRLEAFEELMSRDIPAVIITRGQDPCPECMEVAVKYNTPVMRTGEQTSMFVSGLANTIRAALAPRITRHGVLIEVYGEGILLLGESGVGKSETAIELVKRGHRLIADDAVELKKMSSRTIVGTSPELIRHFIEIRGIGVVDVRRIFGMGSVKMSEKVDLIINLEHWQEGREYERLGIDGEYSDILDVKIPSLTVPVRQGRNLAVIIEVAAMNNRQKKMGYNAAQEISNRVFEQVNSQFAE